MLLTGSVLKIIKGFTLEEAGKKYYKNRNDLITWAQMNGYSKLPISEKARLKLEEDLENHDFYDYKVINGVEYPVRSNKPILSPLSSKDEGLRFINCITNTLDIPNDELSRIMINVNSWIINNYYQELRRRISILERPLLTSRGDGKSYIYSNYNPKYAQYIVTIFRTFYNFCWEKKINGYKSTPAQRLGITNKVFNEKDIIYFK